MLTIIIVNKVNMLDNDVENRLANGLKLLKHSNQYVPFTRFIIKCSFITVGPLIKTYCDVLDI